MSDIRPNTIAAAVLLFLITAFGSSIPIPVRAAVGPLDRTGTLWAPHLEWSFKNPSWEGNPFDISATATFVHPASGETRTTGMFYDGGKTWKIRFTATRPGQWRFTTASVDLDLDGKRGAVTVELNPDQNIKGFLTHVGGKFAVQRRQTDDLEGYLFNVYMGGVNVDYFLDTFSTNLEKVAANTLAYLAEARDNGCEVLFIHVNNNWLQFGERRHDRHDRVDPDLVAFRVLETIITTAHQAGGRVHLWAWGDQQRRWTPAGLPGGINGHVDRRLQRYIAARLGPLPGWTMGYGFDLHEWTNEDQVNAWARHLGEQFGWPHLLSARAFRLQGPLAIQSYDCIGRDVPLATTPHGPKDYTEMVRHLDVSFGVPVLYEERHTYMRPGFDLDMDGTRRLLWWQAMAGGVGGFIGFYEAGSGAFGGHPYPNPEQLRTHYTFWHTHRRFLLGMRRANELSRGDALVLRDVRQAHYVVYQEQTDAIEIDLTGMERPQPIVAVDAAKAYAEISLGVFKPGPHAFKLPRASDWALAIGTFSQPRTN